MSKSIKITFIIALLVNFSICAQKFEFDDVSVDELKEKFHPLDSSASAAVLFNVAKINLLNSFNLEVKKRIKIYNDSGYKYATIELPYNSSYSDIKKIKAYIYDLDDNNNIIKKKLDKDQIIVEELTDDFEQVKFTFPNLKNGSVLEYSYVQDVGSLYSLPEWDFQEEIPVNISSYELITPKFVKYNETAKGYHFIDRKVETNQRYHKFTYTAEKLPKLEEEPFVNNINNYRTSIRHELSFYVDSYNVAEEFSTNWKELSLKLQESDNFGKQLDENRYFRDDLDLLIKKSQSQQQKIEKIFNYIKQKITWNERLDIYTSEKLKKIYKEKIGNSSDINLMLIAMLRYAGFQAHPVLISTVDNGIPSRSVSLIDYNSVIAAVELSKQKTILLDATQKFSTTSILPTSCLNWRGRLVRPNGTSKEINLNPKAASEYYAVMNIKLDKSGRLEGQIRRIYSRQFAYEYRNKFDAINQKVRIEELQNKLGAKISDLTVQNMEDLEKNIIETFSFNKDDAIEIINDNMYMSPLLFLALSENPFKPLEKARIYPIDFTFPKIKRYVINVEVPEDYSIEFATEDVALDLIDNTGSYQFNINHSNESNIQIMIKQKINKSILGPEYYKLLKEFYSRIVNKENSKLVLIKKT